MSIPFVLYLSIIAIEYTGAAWHYLPFLRVIPIIPVVVILLTIYYLFTGGIKWFLSDRIIKILLFFIFLSFIAIFHGFLSVKAYEAFETEVGYFLLLILTAYSINSFHRLKIFAICYVLTHVFLVFVNLDSITSTAREGAFKAGYFLGDGNDFAWSLNVALPFAILLIYEYKSRIYKGLLWIVFALIIIFGIVGTQSRGATLALASSLLFMWIYIVKRKSIGVIMIFIAGIGALAFAPETYTTRMSTLTHYEEDSSAMGRIYAWKAATRMALDHPVLGVGAGSFNSMYGRFYRPEHASARWISTHSVYFKILAEYSFIGLFTFLLMLYFIYKKNKETATYLKENGYNSTIPNYTPLLINMSLIGYSVSGMFLGGIDYPHIYILIGITMALARIIDKEKSLNNSIDYKRSVPIGTV